eukprot:scaffold301126_cov28-Tisochrysis_lutea.AAC.1
MLGLGQSGYATGCECEYGAVEQSQSLKHLKIHGLDNKKISQPQLGICWELQPSTFDSRRGKLDGIEGSRSGQIEVTIHAPTDVAALTEDSKIGSSADGRKPHNVPPTPNELSSSTPLRIYVPKAVVPL